VLDCHELFTVKEVNMRALRYRASILVVVACLCVAFAAWADVQLMDFSGFDWFWPGDIGQAGSCYSAVGFVNSFNPTYVDFDYGTNEYTFVLAEEYACYASGDTFGTTAVYTYDAQTTNATFRVYCDSIATGTPADYGTNPPDSLPIGTFTDGDCILEAEFQSDLTIIVSLSTGNGNISALLEWTGGSQIGNIPPEQRSQSLTVAGLTFDPPGGPSGYHWQIDGEVFIEDPVAVEPRTWGQIKTLDFDTSGGN
jgi:hypothetical protein